MKLPHIVLIIVFSTFISVLTERYLLPQREFFASNSEEPAYKRVLKSGTLRCGYQYYESGVMRAAETGQIYGPDVEIMNAIGTATGLKVEWVAQVGWDEVGAALRSQKIDAMCAGMWTSAAKAKEITFTTPFAYQAIESFVRTSDHRFDSRPESINKPEIKIAVIDNDNSDFIARQDFPKAQRVTLGQMNGTDGDLLMYVVSNKSDVAFTAAGFWQQFNKNNMGKIRRLNPGIRLRVFGLALAVSSDEWHLLQILNAGEQEIQNSGELDKILDKANQTWPDMYIKPINMFP